ncbi:MAG: (d)CMP kinase [Planctomycetota bacterium]
MIAIDGPAGAGKSTVARQVAERLDGFHFLDTGAMYRAVTAYLIRIDKLDAPEEEMARISEGLENDGETLLVDGVDVSGDIRTAQVTAEVSRVSAFPKVRRVIQRKQKEVKGSIVAEGRDMGSVVFPNALLKVYLDASLMERARRRAAEFPGHSQEETAALIAKRDAHDSGREDSPLVQADGAIHLDTTDLTIEEVVGNIVALVNERRGNQGDGPGQ